MLFLNPGSMKALTDRLLEAAQHRHDPESEVQIALAEFGVLPEVVRAEVEADASLKAAQHFAQDRADARAALAAINPPSGVEPVAMNLDLETGELTEVA